MAKRKIGPAGNENYQAQLRRLQAERERQDADDLLSLLRTPAGRRFLYRLIYQHLRLEYGHGGDGFALHRHLGAQDAGRSLKARIMAAAPDLWILAVEEQTKSAINQAVSQRAALDREQAPEDPTDDN